MFGFSKNHLCAGRLLACEMVALGRTASGERFTHGLVLDSWRIRRDGGLVWADALRLDGPPPTGLSGFGDATSIATANLAKAHGIVLTSLEDSPRVDLTIDGADEVDPRLR